MSNRTGALSFTYSNWSTDHEFELTVNSVQQIIDVTYLIVALFFIIGAASMMLGFVAGGFGLKRS
jgi:hypothetical protein